MQHENCNASFSQSISTDDLNFLTSAIITHFISILLSGEQLNYTHRSCLTLCSESSIDMRSYLFLQATNCNVTKFGLRKGNVLFDL